jgi:hypothetical protein
MSNNQQKSRLWALAECCYILDQLQSVNDRLAVIDALDKMATMAKPVLKSEDDKVHP